MNNKLWFNKLLNNNNNNNSRFNLIINDKTTTTTTTSATMFQLYLITIISCLIISFSSMLMLLIFLKFIQNNTNKYYSFKNNQNQINKNESIKFDPEKSEFLKLILAFAVGALIADVFLHILPEACEQLIILQNNNKLTIQNTQHYIGKWILIGIVIFATIETFMKIYNNCCSSDNNDNDDDEKISINDNNNEKKFINNGNNNNNVRHRKQKNDSSINNETISIKNNNNKTNVTGYINLFANGFDNFTHGMSVAASFLINYKMGIMTTIAITLHEMPHEIVDFILLIRSGFSCWNAFKAQLSITIFTIIGNISVLYFEQQSKLNLTLWILPLTSGGFLYIALTSLLPELLNIDNNNNNNDNDELITQNGHLNKSTNKLHNNNKLYKYQKIFCLLIRILFIIFGIIIMETINTIEL